MTVVMGEDEDYHPIDPGIVTEDTHVFGGRNVYSHYLIPIRYLLLNRNPLTLLSGRRLVRRKIDKVDALNKTENKEIKCSRKS